MSHTILMKTDGTPPYSGPPAPSILQPLIRLASLAVLALLFCSGLPGDAKAEFVRFGTIDYGDDDDPNDHVWQEWFIDDETWDVWMGIKNKDGSYDLIKVGSNPGPDDTSSGGKGDKSTKIPLAKQSGGGKVWSEKNFWNTPVGRGLGSGGNGPGVVWNPADDDRAGTGNPSLGGKPFTGKAEFIGGGSVRGPKGGGFQPNGGSVADQLKKGGGPGSPPGSGDDDDDDGKGSHKPPPGSFIGPADLVDPLPPVPNRIATGSKTAAGKPGKSLKSVKSGQGTTARNSRRSVAQKALGGPDTKGLGGPDTKRAKAKAGKTSMTSLRGLGGSPLQGLPNHNFGIGQALTPRVGR